MNIEKSRRVKFPPAMEYFLERGYELRIRLKSDKLHLEIENVSGYETDDFRIVEMAQQAQREICIIEDGKTEPERKFLQ